MFFSGHLCWFFGEIYFSIDFAMCNIVARCGALTWPMLNANKIWEADWCSGLCRGLRTKGSLVPDLDGSPFVLALSKSHLPLLSTG